MQGIGRQSGKETRPDFFGGVSEFLRKFFRKIL